VHTSRVQLHGFPHALIFLILGAKGLGQFCNFADFTDIGQLRAMDGKTLDGQTLTVSKAGQQPWRVTLRQGLQLVTVVSTDTRGSKVRLKWCFLMFSHDFWCRAFRPKPTYRPQADPNENFKKAFGIPWHTI